MISNSIRALLRTITAISCVTMLLGAADLHAAATVAKFVGGSVLRFTAGPGEQNFVQFTRVGSQALGNYIIADTVPPIAGTGCAPVPGNPYQVSCPAAGVTILQIFTGDLNDTILGAGSAATATIDAGPGNDFIEGSGAGDFINAGTGNDTIYGYLGNDVIDGGPGFDTATYDAATGVTVTLDNLPNDGVPGENDNVWDTVERVVGGPGPDTLVGSSFANTLEGGAGNDTIVVDGDGTQDIVDGGSGSDDCRRDAADSTTNCEAPFSSSFYGVNGTPGTTGSPQGILDAYRRAEEAGLEWVRIFFPWSDIAASGSLNFETAPTGPSDWCACGGCPSIAQKIKAARTANPTRAIIGVLDGGNWINPPAPGAFAAFAAAAAQRFKDDVAVWELWNEPNLPNHWSGNASQYRDLILAPGYTAIKTAVPTAKVAAPALHNPSTTQMNNFLGNSGGTFLVPVDIVTFHLYGSRTDVFNAGNTLDTWCDNQAGCHEWWLTENGFATTGSAGACGTSGVKSPIPGDDLVAVFSRCENSLQWFYCGGTFIYNLHDRTNLNGSCGNPTAIGCDLGLLKADGTIRNKLCKVENYTTGMYLTPGCQ